MAATTIQSRVTWTDDDGSGATGTILNNAQIQAVQDIIDAILSGNSPYQILSVGGIFRVEGQGHQVKGASAPSTAAAGEGAFYFDSSRKLWLQSMNGSAYQPFATVLDKSTTEQDVVSTNTETSVYSFTVKGGLLDSNGALLLLVDGSYLNNTGSNQNLFVSVKYGGSIVAGGPSGTGAALGGGNYSSQANRHPFQLQTLLTANNATNSQRAVTTVVLGTPKATETDWAGVDTHNQAMTSSLAIDTTADQTLTVTIQHGTSNANLSFRRFAVTLLLVG